MTTTNIAVQSLNLARDQARAPDTFNFGASAELFPRPNRKSARTLRYKRFDKAAEAIRYAVEEMPASALLGAYLEVAEKRYSGEDIRRLYDSPAYPLRRRKVAVAKETT